MLARAFRFVSSPAVAGACEQGGVWRMVDPGVGAQVGLWRV